MTKLQDAATDLVAEGEELDAMLAGLTPEQWSLPTPAPGWRVAHQAAHLVADFRLAGLSARDPDTFVAMASKLSDDFTANVEMLMAEFVSYPPPALLSRMRVERAAAENALAALPPDQMVPWLVRPIPAAILSAAGMMEIFAHGQDIADAVGIERKHTDRIWHLAHFAVRAWDFGYLARGEEAPDVQFRFELTAPSGELWTFGPDDAQQRITGPAVDFCLLVVRRRHRDDVKVTAVGPDADHWLTIAQAYRGPAGEGRTPGQFAAAGKR